jgi:hypothetical protein
LTLRKIEILDKTETVRGTAKVESTDDAQAIAEVHRADVFPIGIGFDIWDGERLVYRYRHP